MSAKDDAVPRPLRRTLPLIPATLFGGAIGAAVAFFAIPDDQPLFLASIPWSDAPPAARDWPRAPRPGERARLVATDRAHALEVRAPRAPRVRELAAEFAARREGGVRQLQDRAEVLRQVWRDSAAAAPAHVTLTPAGERAAWLLARARYDRDVAGSLPAPWTASPDAPMPNAPVEVSERLAASASASDSLAPGSLRAALAALAAAESEWFARGVPVVDAPYAARAGSWQRWHLACADSFAAAAGRALATMPPAERDSLAPAAASALVRLDEDGPPPFAALVRSISPRAAPDARPIAGAWAAWLGGGVLLGALGCVLAMLLGSLVRGPRRRARVSVVPMRDPGAREVWLHVVSGPSPTAVARATIELSAHALARNERVLVVDGSPRLKLHERFGREARWGLMECLLADMPVLGLVQYGGRPGFYLLAHGSAARGGSWATLGQCLDAARQHFGRVVLALDASAPREIGDALAGRALEGWWADAPARPSGAAVELIGRLGIAFSDMELSEVSEVSLEALGVRTKTLSLRHLATPAAVAPPALKPLRWTAIPAPPEPVVLDCDLQVRQRLRFLAWMRRVQAERRRDEAQAVS